MISQLAPSVVQQRTMSRIERMPTTSDPSTTNVAKTTAHHLGGGLLERPFRRREHHLGGEVRADELGVDVLSHAVGMQDVALR